jgi:hypothetical protein
MAWLKAYLPEQPTLRYDAYLLRPDTYKSPDVVPSY